jgi:anti-sigma regulatory factor (Ser/Thr protein kinase)
VPDLGAASAPLLSCPFDRGQLTATRYAVIQHSTDAGLTGTELSNFVLAVNEVVTNAIVHGGGSGYLRLWRTVGWLHCEVTDRGTGADQQRLGGEHLPPSTASGGRGMYLVHQLCETVSVTSDRTGTMVCLSHPIRHRGDLRAGD